MYIGIKCFIFNKNDTTIQPKHGQYIHPTVNNSQFKLLDAHKHLMKYVLRLDLLISNYNNYG